MTARERLAAAGYEATVVHPGPKRKGAATILVVGDGLRTYVREDDDAHVDALVSPPVEAPKKKVAAKPKGKGTDA